MVVDDERAWRVIMETDLSLMGYRVVLAKDAPEALEQARGSRPEVAIVDLMLPEPTDGWALVDQLREAELSMPVIFYTAYPIFPMEREDPDVLGCVSKATDRADLYAMLPRAIRKSRSERT